MQMNFPSWAPTSLIEHLEKLKQLTSKFDFDIEDQVKSIAAEFSLNEAAIKDLRSKLLRSQIILPKDEGIKLIEKLISSPQMKTVWAALKKRNTSDRYAIDLYSVCDSIICSWRADPKLSPSERADQLLQIIRSAEQLESLLSKSLDFHHYHDVETISDEKISWLLEELSAESIWRNEKQNIDYARFCLHEVVPSIHVTLLNIQTNAAKYLQIEPLVRKPQSKNADIHYFIRLLSNYFRRNYGQPLHDSVAATTCTIFDRDDIDVDYVRKLVALKQDDKDVK